MSVSYIKKLGLLFATFFCIALFVVGGGLAMLPVIEQKFVRKNKLLSKSDLLDMISLTQIVPGLIAVNSAVYVGSKVAGFVGAVVAAFAVILPSIIIILILALFFKDLDSNNPIIMSIFSAVRSCITGVFLVTFMRLQKNVLVSPVVVFIVFILFVLLVIGINPVIVLLGGLPIGYIYFYLATKSFVPDLLKEKK
ncbi:MAG: chromate transporter [Alphaproteobacteria bacterium]|nr:chromate transporter [Alphaproteobacteria bacterium]